MGECGIVVIDDVASNPGRHIAAYIVGGAVLEIFYTFSDFRPVTVEFAKGILSVARNTRRRSLDDCVALLIARLDSPPTTEAGTPMTAFS